MFTIVILHSDHQFVVGRKSNNKRFDRRNKRSLQTRYGSKRKRSRKRPHMYVRAVGSLGLEPVGCRSDLDRCSVHDAASCMCTVLCVGTVRVA